MLNDIPKPVAKVERENFPRRQKDETFSGTRLKRKPVVVWVILDRCVIWSTSVLKSVLPNVTSVHNINGTEIKQTAERKLFR